MHNDHFEKEDKCEERGHSCKVSAKQLHIPIQLFLFPSPSSSRHARPKAFWCRLLVQAIVHSSLPPSLSVLVCLEQRSFLAYYCNVSEESPLALNNDSWEFGAPFCPLAWSFVCVIIFKWFDFVQTFGRSPFTMSSSNEVWMSVTIFVLIHQQQWHIRKERGTMARWHRNL